MAFLRQHQEDAVKKMKNGCILCGSVGSGKSRTGLAYYYLRQGGRLNDIRVIKNRKPLYIITTARKRDTRDWEKEMTPFGLTATVDSWNNIAKYKDVTNAFFIFDEQRVVGKGKWSKTFIKLSKFNEWILLSATPGDKWEDYIPVFIANGFFRNRSEFMASHAIFSRFTKYPDIIGYINEGMLIKMRNSILIDMDYKTPAQVHNIFVNVSFPIDIYRFVLREKKNPETLLPFENASEFCYCLRKIVNSHEDRLNKCYEIVKEKSKAIIYYSFDYELELLKALFDNSEYVVGEWNGHRHDDVPDTDKWVYLVNYGGSGAEGWNCIKTDTMIFYSQTYSYRTLVQARGRIDRMNTPYKDLYYYHLKSLSTIDNSIAAALRNKKTFNERAFMK